MAIDSKGNNHQPKGMPDAGKFAPKAGAGDDDDLWYKPRYLVVAGRNARLCMVVPAYAMKTEYRH